MGFTSEYKSVLVVCLIAFILNSCDTTGPANINKFTLTVEDVSCTEAWLKLTHGGFTSAGIINIMKDGIVAASINNFKSNDTTVFIDSLLPNKQYSFQAIANENYGITNGSEKITVTTLDTTSHNFTWETFQFGDYDSRLWDVAIVNDNNIWAVGEIYLNDSNGQEDPLPYNVVHWDGISWDIKRITIPFRGSLVSVPLEGICAFSNGEMWIAGGGIVIYSDGENWVPYDVRLITGHDSLSFIKCWGVNSSTMYFIGLGGSLTFYNGHKWQKIESGTKTQIIDVWGISNSNIPIIYCPVSALFEPGDIKILKFKNNKLESVSWDLVRLLNGVWTDSERYLYVCGGGVFENKKGQWNEIDLPLYTTNRIRGNKINDIFVVGDFGLVAHFNGISWKVYEGISDFYTGYTGLSVNENLLAISGQRNGKGIITIGHRN